MKKTEIAAYYFPQYHKDPRNDVWQKPNWDEWEMVKAAKPRFKGHDQPKIPLWGYEDESKAEVFEKKIAAASDHGITTFIFDWYWYDDKPFLNKALENGYMNASNNSDVKFALMWANHDWMDLYPVEPNKPQKLLEKGSITRESFELATDYIVKNYFKQPSYMKIDGKPYFSIFHLETLIKGLNGLEETKKALDSFREKTIKAGFDGLNLNVILMTGCEIAGIKPSSNRVVESELDRLYKELGFDSITSYVWFNNTDMHDFPMTEYETYAEEAMKKWETFTEIFTLPYFPNVTMGWDASPRTDQNDLYENLGYPYTPILVNNTPEAFEKVLLQSKQFLEKGHTNPPLLIINSWNEWTEGSYLEPDTRNGMKYLEAVKRVYGINY